VAKVPEVISSLECRILLINRLDCYSGGLALVTVSVFDVLLKKLTI